VNIMLSDFGKEKLNQVITERKAIVDRYLLKLTEEELLQFAKITERLAEIVTSYD
jgi:DNA-binding MarR family transcriptional regulator